MVTCIEGSLPYLCLLIGSTHVSMALRPRHAHAAAPARWEQRVGGIHDAATHTIATTWEGTTEEKVRAANVNASGYSRDLQVAVVERLMPPVPSATVLTHCFGSSLVGQ